MHVTLYLIQPVPEKMRLEMLVKTQIQILDGRSPGLFSNEPFEKRPVMTIEDFVLHFDDHFDSHLGNGLYRVVTTNKSFIFRVRFPPEIISSSFASAKELLIIGLFCGKRPIISSFFAYN